MEFAKAILKAVSGHPEIWLGIVAVVVTIALTEVLKPWAKLATARAGIVEGLEASVLRSLSFAVSAVPVIILDFRGTWDLAIDGHPLGYLEALLVGCSITWVGVQITWMLIHDIRPVRALRVWIYKTIGVTEEDIRETREQATITPKQLGGDDDRRGNGKRRDSDDD